MSATRLTYGSALADPPLKPSSASASNDERNSVLPADQDQDQIPNMTPPCVVRDLTDSRRVSPWRLGVCCRKVGAADGANPDLRTARRRHGRGAARRPPTEPSRTAVVRLPRRTPPP